MSFAYRPATEDTQLGAEAIALAGGTDLLPLHKLGLIDVAEVVDLKTGGLPSEISVDDGRWRLGALATLADVEDDGLLGATFPGLTEAARQAATRQIRNRATVGGNLLQRPRCRYYRDEALSCWFDGGEGCPARNGRNEHHAIFDTSPCAAVQPSDLASVLVSLDARVVLCGSSDRVIPVADLLRPPSEERRVLHDLADGQLIAAIEIDDRAGLRSGYRKAMDRAAWQFALVGVAAAIQTDDAGEIVHASVVASGVANVPWRLHRVEEALLGEQLSEKTIRAAASVADDGAAPLEHNAYKRPLLRGLTQRVLEDVLEDRAD